ncbi:MAG: chemotaxis protein CheA [Gemmatimonadales bacterium]|nr:chemotaxis protein CheA [Gemmatimonadales bacterium]NIN11329.1 chemotaxis protein CheA [Gemmatimonadales bacterium]NIN49939.1 chemotaxis protein CheA [Gemmatimonadales bacterium]NIP07403.1 chemotaxis protein CheA [Gemmatimonadales bacterium]NIR00470.1 chemotaxis protein CheA [Gemmatimonadales bacterium]
MDRSQYAELFLAESREHLSTVNQLLLEWERDPQASEPVQGIFRAVHTIKGMAATMGYGKVADLAHRTENLLDLLRRGDLSATDEILELLFQSADSLDRAVEASVAGREADLDVSAVVRAVDQAATAYEQMVPRPAKARPSAPVVAAPPGVGRRVQVVLRQETPLKGARAILILRRVEALGTLFAVEPAPVALEAEGFDGRFAFRIEAAVSDEVIERTIREAGDVERVELVAEEAAAPRPEAAGGPARHIRVDLRRLDALMNRIGELVTSRDRLAALSTQRADPELEDLAVGISRLSGELQEEIIQARMTPVWQVFDRFPRLVRDLARRLGKQIAFRVAGKEIELDRAILEEIGDALVHLLRNAVDHGIESPDERTALGKPPEGVIELSAARERATVAIRVQDDGRGIDREKVLAKAKARGLVEPSTETLTDDLLVRVLARSGFTTAARVSDVSGRGVGVDVVADRVRALGGAVEVQSRPGEGTTFTLRLPTTLAIVRALITRVGEERYALPITHVAETLDLDAAAVTQVDGRDAMTLREAVVPLVHLRQLLEVSGEEPARRPVIVLQIGERRTGLVVDRLVGQQEIVVKTITPLTGMLPIFSGATILSEGLPVLILDAGALV